MNILGISAYYHDSAACLVSDGHLVAAAQEERFTRRKHDAGFPLNAVKYCLAEGGVASGGIDAVVFYDKPLTKFARIAKTYFATAPRGLQPFLMAMPLWLREKLWIPTDIADALEKAGGGKAGQLYFCEHHESHAASAFFPSPFDSAAVLTMDGVGEWATTSLGHGRDNRLEMLERNALPAFAGPALLGFHLLHRIPGQLGRIQADGPGALRRTALRRPHSGQPGGRPRGRFIPAQPGLLQLP